MAKSELSGHFFSAKNQNFEKRSLEDFFVGLGMLHAQFGPIWMKNQGLDSFFSNFQLKKDVISVI